MSQVIDGVTWTAAGNQITGVSNYQINVVVPSTVNGTTITSLGNFLFKDKTNLHTISIPDSVTTIGQQCCFNVVDLSSVTFGANSGLTTLNGDAFMICRKLTNFIIPSGVTTFNGTNHFQECKMTSLTVPAGVVVLPQSVFYNMTELTELIFAPNSLCTTIGFYSVNTCNKLQSVRGFPAHQIASMNANSFNKMGPNPEIVFARALTSTERTTFLNTHQSKFTTTNNTVVAESSFKNPPIPPTNIVISNNTVDELKLIGTIIGTLSCDNPDNANIVYSISDTRFSIVNSVLKTNIIFNYNVSSTYTITVTASISGLTSSNNITITINNISNEDEYITVLINGGVTVRQLLAAGFIPYFGADPSANRLKQSYVKDFIDISGSLLLRNNANLYVHGNTTVKGKLMLNNTNMQADLSFNNRILVGGDMSMNGNATIANDVSLNGSVLGCIFNNNSIPIHAFAGDVTAPSPDYTKASVIYQQKFRADGDVSMNGSTVQATNITVNGNIEFNDGTKMTTYDDNKTVSLTDSTYDSSLNNTTFLAPVRWMAGSEGGKYLYMVTGSYRNTAGEYNATTNTGAFYKSDTYGDTWTKITIPGSNEYYTGGIDSSTTGQYVIVGTHAWTTSTQDISNNGLSDKFYISNNYGVDWSAGLSMNAATNNAISGLRLAAVSMSATGQYIAVMPYTQGPTYAYSSNSGVSFSAKSGALYELNYILDGTHMSMSYDGRYLYGGKIGIFRLDTTNGTQQLIQDGGTNKSGCSLSCSKKSYLMAYFHINLSNTADNNVYVCTDGLTPVTRTIPNSAQSKRVYIDYNEYIYVASASACYVSIDTGTSWSQLTFGSTISNTINYIYVTPKYIFTGEGTQYGPGNGMFLPVTVDYKKYIRQTLFKASTFSNLTIIGALRYGTLNSSSDYRIKNNAAKLDNTFTVDNLRPVKYFQTLLNKQQYGLIAHELQQYYPDLVLGEKDGHNLQSVNYTGLIAILINEIIRLKREFTELEK